MIQPRYQLRFNRDDQWHMDRPHFHEDVEILLSLSDGGDFFIGDSLYPLHHGTLLLLSEATLHKSIASDSYRRYVLHLAPDTLRAFSTTQSDLTAFVQKSTGRCKHLEKKQTRLLVEKFKKLDEPYDQTFGSDLQKNVQLLDFLLTVFVLFESAEAEVKAQSADFARIGPILKYIQANLDKPLTLDILASHFFINKYYMSHIFKAATGFSIIEYIIYSRVLRARELLRQGLRVQDVGERVGFQNNAHFIRTFGKLTGISPKQYAKEYLLGDKIAT